MPRLAPLKKSPRVAVTADIPLTLEGADPIERTSYVVRAAPSVRQDPVVRGQRPNQSETILSSCASTPRSGRAGAAEWSRRRRGVVAAASTPRSGRADAAERTRRRRGEVTTSSLGAGDRRAKSRDDGLAL